MDRMLDRFETEIKKNTGDKVKVTVIHRMSGLVSQLDSNEDARDSAGGRTEEPQQHKWVKRMDEFRTALTSIHRILEETETERPERVKVSPPDICYYYP